MKNLFKKGAVAAAVAGSLMVSGVASADSLLAPLVIGLDNGEQTYFSLKMSGGSGGASSPLHYVWFKKGSTRDSLYNLNTPCTVSSNTGHGSPWDMVYQRAVKGSANGEANIAGASNNLPNGLPADDLDASGQQVLRADTSKPNGFPGPFVGFVTITDVNNQGKPGVKDLAAEGELSGFAYVVDPTNSVVLDYKLLNNHRSKVEGDFDIGFISKKAVDFSWMPEAIAYTEWLTVAISDDMSKKADSTGKYDATVLFSQEPLANSQSPQVPFGNQAGAYNNDEVVIDGGKDFSVTCMGMYRRDTFLNEHQYTETAWGGWKRMSIADTTKTGAGTTTASRATGAITYKAEMLNFMAADVGLGLGAVDDAAAELYFGKTIGSISAKYLSFFGKKGTASIMGLGLDKAVASANPSTVSGAEVFDIVSPSNPINNLAVGSFQIETSGHLSTTSEPHPNRPY